MLSVWSRVLALPTGLEHFLYCCRHDVQAYHLLSHVGYMLTRSNAPAAVLCPLKGSCTLKFEQSPHRGSQRRSENCRDCRFVGAGVRESLQPLSQCPALAKSSVGGICDDCSTMVGASTNQIVCSQPSLTSVCASSFLWRPLNSTRSQQVAWA